jgi:hypothetical protein
VAAEESLNHEEGRGGVGRGEVLKPRGGHQKHAGGQVVEEPHGGPKRGQRGVSSPRGGPGGHGAMILVTITETIRSRDMFFIATFCV